MSGLLSVDMPLFIILKWMVLLLIFAGLWVWLAVENRSGRALLEENKFHPALKTLLHQSRLRSHLFLVLYFMFCITVGAYDIRFEKLSGKVEATTSQETPLFAQPMLEIPESESPAPPIPITVTESIFSPASAQASAEMEHTSKLDELKVKYEDLIVTYLYLAGCKQATEQEFNTIIYSLDAEMMGLEAAPSLRDNIITAAKGSYQEIYSGSGCDEATLAPTRAGFQAFLAQSGMTIAKKPQ